MPHYPMATTAVDHVEPVPRWIRAEFAGRVVAVRPTAGRRCLESRVAGLAGTVRFDWDALDTCYEEDEEVFVHPRNPYVRVMLFGLHEMCASSGMACSRALGFAGTRLRDRAPTRHYFDRTSADLSHLLPSDTVSSCP